MRESRGAQVFIHELTCLCKLYHISSWSFCLGFDRFRGLCFYRWHINKDFLLESTLQSPCFDAALGCAIFSLRHGRVGYRQSLSGGAVKGVFITKGYSYGLHLEPEQPLVERLQVFCL